MVFKNLCILVLWTKIASALERLSMKRVQYPPVRIWGRPCFWASPRLAGGFRPDYPRRSWGLSRRAGVRSHGRPCDSTGRQGSPERSRPPGASLRTSAHESPRPGDTVAPPCQTYPEKQRKSIIFRKISGILQVTVQDGQVHQGCRDRWVRRSERTITNLHGLAIQWLRLVKLTLKNREKVLSLEK